MIKLKYSNFQNQNFHSALEGLKAFRLPTKTAYEVAKIAKAIDEEAKNVQIKYLEMVKEYARKDEQGNIVPFEGKEGTFDVPEENRQAYMQAFIKFNQTEFEIDRRKLSLSELEAASLSAGEMEALEPILTELSLVEPSLVG